MPILEPTSPSSRGGSHPPETREGSRDDLRGQSPADLLRSALEEARRLAQLEVAIAREEVRTDVRRAERAGSALGAAGALGLSGFSLIMVAIAAAFAKIWLAALVFGGILLTMSAALGLAGWLGIPKKPLGETRERIDADLTKVKERMLS